MVTVCLYQDTRHRHLLEELRERIGSGYLSDRNDHITELRIQGYRAVRILLTALEPYLLFKKQQAALALKMLYILENRKFSALAENERRAVAQCIIGIRKKNYQGHMRRHTDVQIRQLLLR